MAQLKTLVKWQYLPTNGFVNSFTFTWWELLLLSPLPAAILLADYSSEAVPQLVALVTDDVGLLTGPVPHAVAALQPAVDDARLVADDGFCKYKE